MQATNIWNKLHLHRKEIALLLMLLVGCGSIAIGQTTRWVKKNNPNYDERKLTYGFLIGLHTTAYKTKYSNRFVSQAFDSVYAVEPVWSPGFALGFIVNYRIADFFDLRLTPSVSFNENKLDYLFTNDTPPEQQVVETTMVEFPILLKYKSERRGNIRMYMIGGVKPAIDASGKKGIENATSSIEVKGGNLSVDFGFGFDMYYPLFKFSPEIRFSKGLVDVLDNRTNQYGQPLQSLSTNTITVYLLFQ